MKKKSDYYELLKDPQWQKKRLKILERDQWTCQKCFDSENTLNVHHYVYKPGAKPWEYPDDALVTLCESCHQEEKDNYQISILKLQVILAQTGFFADTIDSLADALYDLDIPYPPEVKVTFLKWLFNNKKVMDSISEMYWKWLHKEADKIRQKKNKKNG